MTDSSGEARTPQEGTVDAGALAEASKLYAELDDLSLRITDERLDEIHDRLLSLGRSLLAYIKQLREERDDALGERVIAQLDIAKDRAEAAEAQVKQLEGERDELQLACDHWRMFNRKAEARAEKAERALAEILDAKSYVNAGGYAVTADEAQELAIKRARAALRPSEADVMATTEIPEVDVQRAAELARERGWKNIPVVGDES